MLEDESKKLTPTIHLPVSIRPEEKYTLKVAEKTGQAMTYTVAIVDEGLLGLTRFKTPDPYAHFYAKEALGVKSWDMYQYVLGALSGEMTSLLATGGDGEIINKNAEKAQRFKPVVRLSSSFTRRQSAYPPNYLACLRRRRENHGYCRRRRCFWICRKVYPG